MLKFQIRHPLTGEAVVCFARYRNDRVAIQLHGAPGSAFANEPIGTVTVNLPEVPLADDEVAIKTYSEHAGILDPLVAAGVVEARPRAVVQSGFVQIPIHRLTPAALAEARAIVTIRMH